ncbi:TPA: glycosyltransferase family 4 protein [Legionella pneumophila]
MSRKVLILTPRYPYPVIGGDRLRIFEICRELAKHCELTLLSLCESEEEMQSTIPQDGVFNKIERVYLPKWRSILNVLSALPRNIPLQIAYYNSAEFRHRLEEMIGQHDICLAHLIRTGHYITSAKIPTILEMTDAISMSYQRLHGLKKVKGIKSLIYKFEAKRLYNYERTAIEKFPVVSLVSSCDRDFLLEGRVVDNVITCSNGVDWNLHPFSKRENSEPVITFIGNMTAVPNLDACFYFANNILPLINSKLTCTFRVIGRIRRQDAVRLENINGVEVVGNVENISAAVGNARMGVAPMRIGAGVQNKVLEYMSLGLPVITSPIALEGLKAQPGKDLLVADSPEEFVEQIDRLWNNQLLRSQLALSGLNYIKNNHSWSEQLKPLVEKVMSASL